jgi:hypothetical protein
MSKQQYRALTGMSYPVDVELDAELRGGRALSADEVAELAKAGTLRRIEAGAIVDDLPAESVPWLLKQKHIERYPKKRDKRAGG